MKMTEENRGQTNEQTYWNLFEFDGGFVQSEQISTSMQYAFMHEHFECCVNVFIFEWPRRRRSNRIMMSNLFGPFGHEYGFFFIIFVLFSGFWHNL